MVVAIDGKLTHNAHEYNDGKKGYFTQVVINHLLMLGKAAAA